MVNHSILGIFSFFSVSLSIVRTSEWMNERAKGRKKERKNYLVIRSLHLDTVLTVFAVLVGRDISAKLRRKEMKNYSVE